MSSLPPAAWDSWVSSRLSPAATATLSAAWQLFWVGSLACWMPLIYGHCTHVSLLGLSSGFSHLGFLWIYITYASAYISPAGSLPAWVLTFLCHLGHLTYLPGSLATGSCLLPWEVLHSLLPRFLSALPFSHCLGLLPGFWISSYTLYILSLSPHCLPGISPLVSGGCVSS